MNREILKSMDSGRIPIERLVSLLETFALKHAAKSLPDILETADLNGASHKELLLALLETEKQGGTRGAEKGTILPLIFLPT